MVYHVVSVADWKRQASASVYAPSTFQQEGFIHCCTKAQLDGVLQRYYQGQTDLLLLHLDESKLEFKVKYEVVTNDELFPHLYGMLNKTAITSIEKIR